MKRKWLDLLRFEIVSTVGSLSFWIGVLGVPLLGFVTLWIVGQVNSDRSSSFALVAQEFLEKPVDSRPHGFIDESGLIKNFPEDFPTESYIQFVSKDAAIDAVNSGHIQSFYIVFRDFVETGKIVAYVVEFNLLANEETNQLFWRALRFNLINGNTALEDLYFEPYQLEEIALTPPEKYIQDDGNMAGFFIPYTVMMLFYIMVMGSASLLLSSIAKEKENRVIEMLLISTSPESLFTGKIVALGIIGLFQTVIWAGSALLAARINGQSLDIPLDFLTIDLLVWGIIYFVLGYLLYAGFMAGIGALAPSLREGSQISTLVVMPLIIPLFLLNALIEEPNGTWAVLFSIFPLTSPTTMMLRMVSTKVAFWQNAIAVVLLVIAIVVVIRSVARLFRAQTLLSGQSLTVIGYLKALFPR